MGFLGGSKNGARKKKSNYSKEECFAWYADTIAIVSGTDI